MLQILPRRDVASAWVANNPVLGVGEFGYETDTQRYKRGNGTSPWNSLAYADTAIHIGDSTPVGRAVITAANAAAAVTAIGAEPALPTGGNVNQYLRGDKTWQPLSTLVAGGVNVFNAKNYGAVGDGSTDDTAAIVSALAAASAAGGGVVLLPVATYKISSSIKPASSGTFYNVRLTSQAPRGSRGSTAATAVLQAGGTSPILAGIWESCAISDLSLDGAGTAPCTDIHLSHSVIERVETTRWSGAGLRVNSGTYSTTLGVSNYVRGNFLVDSGAVTGPALDLGAYLSQSWIADNTAQTGPGAAAIHLAGGNQLRITGNQVGGSRHPLYAVWFQNGGTDIQITGNTFDGAIRESIRYDASSTGGRAQVIISDNTIRQWGYDITGWPGITLNGGTPGITGFVVSANTFYSDQTKTSAVNVINTGQVLVIGNSWSGGYSSTSSGVVHDTNSTTVRVIGNTDGDNITSGGGGGGGSNTSYTTFIGDGTSTTFTVPHNLGTTDVLISVYIVATGEEIACDKARTGINTVSLTFATAPAYDAYRAVIAT